MMLFLAAPAEAHHPGGGGNTGSGGPINTISADTLDEGLIGASVRYEFIRLGKLSDAQLLAAASQGNHAHSIGSIDAISLSAAYGITNDLTFSVRLPGVRRSDIREPGEDMLSGGHMGNMSAGDMSSLMSSGVNMRGNSAGFGDVTMLGQYRFHNNTQAGTSAAVLFGFKAPTGSTSQRDTAARLGRVGSPSLSIETSAQDIARYPRAAASSSVQRRAPDGRRDRLERRFEERIAIPISDGCYLDSTFFTQGNDPVQPECRSSPRAGRNPQGRRTAAAVLCASLLGFGLAYFACTLLIPALRLDGSGALFPGYDRLMSVVCSSGNSSKPPQTARADE